MTMGRTDQSEDGPAAQDASGGAQEDQGPPPRQERRQERRRRERQRVKKHGASLRRVYRDALGKRASGRPQTRTRRRRLPPGVPKRKKEPGT